MDTEFPATDLDLAALIGSRICHDLISPVGAIGNGVELLTMSGAAAGPELALISESVESASARIKFYRIAFGQASAGQSVGRAEVLSILSDIYKGARLKVHWAPQDDCPRREVQLAFLLLQCLESAMPYGGQVHISRADRAWRLTGEADKMKISETLWPALAGRSPVEVDPGHVHFALAPQAAERMGRRLGVEVTRARIALTF